LVGVLVGSLVPVLSRAQEPPPSTVVVMVTDSLDGPLDLASALLRRTGIHGVSGRDGRIVLRNVPPGRDTLTIRRIGYGPLIVSLDLSPGDTLRLDVVLDPLALALNDIRVTARRGLRTFDRRMRNAIFSPPDSFYPPEALDTFPPEIHVRDILLRSGIANRPQQVLVDGRRQVGRLRLSCPADAFHRGSIPVSIVLNGIVYPDPDDTFFDVQLQRARIRALEIYRNRVEIPLEFPPQVGDAGCVVVVWTR